MFQLGYLDTIDILTLSDGPADVEISLPVFKFYWGNFHPSSLWNLIRVYENLILLHFLGIAIYTQVTI